MYKTQHSPPIQSQKCFKAAASILSTQMSSHITTLHLAFLHWSKALCLQCSQFKLSPHFLLITQMTWTTLRILITPQVTVQTLMTPIAHQTVTRRKGGIIDVTNKRNKDGCKFDGGGKGGRSEHNEHNLNNQACNDTNTYHNTMLPLPQPNTSIYTPPKTIPTPDILKGTQSPPLSSTPIHPEMFYASFPTKRASHLMQLFPTSFMASGSHMSLLRISTQDRLHGLANENWDLQAQIDGLESWLAQSEAHCAMALSGISDMKRRMNAQDKKN